MAIYFSLFLIQRITDVRILSFSVQVISQEVVIFWEYQDFITVDNMEKFHRLNMDSFSLWDHLEQMTE